MNLPLLLATTMLLATTGVLLAPPADHAATGDGERAARLDRAVRWLEKTARDMVRRSRRTMKDGTAAFPPQVGSHYNAFWLRDYEYMLEGAAEAFTPKELTDACRLFVRAQRKDGACVDCIKFDGTPIYQPGYGSMGKNPVADGSPFTVGVAWHTWRRTKDLELVKEIAPALVRAMQAVPRNADTHLVHIRPGNGWDRCPYGFTDTVRKQGDVLFCSLLCVQACGQLADMLSAIGRKDEAKRWRAEGTRVAAAVRKTFWDAKAGLFRAATVQCREPDIWGSAFAVYLGVATDRQALTIARHFQKHYDELVQHGQIRHLPGGVYWQKAGPRDHYQNGAFWATPTGWFVDTLDRVDPALADRTVLDLVADFRRRGVTEWVFGAKTAVPDYLASACLPLAGIRQMRARRAKAETKPTRGKSE